MISDTYYENKSLIKELLLKLYDLPNTVIILGGGNLQGGDPYIKEVALALEYRYVEYNPWHTEHNQFSRYPQFRYKKTFKTGNFSTRYKDLLLECDKLIIFTKYEKTDPFIAQIIKKIQKGDFTKPSVITNG